MSLKAIRAMLEQMDGVPGQGEALAEVEAIEKAAKDIDDNLCAQVFGSNPEKIDAALRVLQSIAENAP